MTDRPFPYWSRLYSYDTGANAMYNSMQTEVHHRVRDGLTFSSAWTWAKNLGDNNGPASTGWAGANGGGRVTNSLDRAADRGDFYATRRHRLTTTAFYDLPFGKGRAFGKNWGRVVDAIGGGWRLAAVMLVQTGPYLTPDLQRRRSLRHQRFRPRIHAARSRRLPAASPIPPPRRTSTAARSSAPAALPERPTSSTATSRPSAASATPESESSRTRYR